MLDYRDSEIPTYQRFAFTKNQLFDFLESARVDNTQPDLILCEDFRLYAHMTQRMIMNEMTPARVIGAIEWFAHAEQVEIRFAHAEAIHTDLFKRLGKQMYKTFVGAESSVVHVLDAFLHIVAYGCH